MLMNNSSSIPNTVMFCKGKEQCSSAKEQGKAGE